MVDVLSLWSEPVQELGTSKDAISVQAERIFRHGLVAQSKIDRRWPSHVHRLYQDARSALTRKNRCLIEGLVLTSALVTPLHAGARNPVSELTALAMRPTNDAILEELPHLELAAGLLVMRPRLEIQAEAFLRDLSAKRGNSYRVCEGLVAYGRDAYLASSP